MVNKLDGTPTQNQVIDKVNEITTSIPYYGTSSTGASTVEKAVSIPAITTLNTGQVLYIRPSVTSTVASSTIKLNNFTAYPMRYNNAAISTSTDSIVWNENFVSQFIFDGNYWQFAGHGLDTNTNTTYSAMSVSEGTTGTATNSRTVRADYLKQIIQGTKLTGLSLSDSSDVVATDSILTGIGKLQAQINASKILINITYDDLVTLKTNGELYEGAFYRITDYVTTCNAYTPRSGEPSRSAGHQFDIIIQALSNSTLADKGTASLHSGDTYFANSNLGAWQIWYDINNDTNKYKWADTTNGKGVIYRMIDERNNDLPYDFKNIQFYRNGSSSSYTSVATYLTAADGYYYTFSLNTSGTITDYSIDGGSYCQKNIHGALGVGQGIGLPNSVWIETATAKELSNNDIGSNSYNNTCCGVFQRIHCPLGAFTNNITNDTFRNSVIASNFKNNVIGTSFDNNEIGHWFTNNTIGTNFKLNSIGESVRYCTFGNTTQYSQIGNYVTYITFGDSFNTGVIQNYISYISIPNKIYNLTIKNNTSGTSTNPLSLSGLPTEVNYSVTVRLDSNSGYIATWNDGITTYGKYKATSGTANWTDVNNKQIQSDWNQTDTNAVDYIKNKPSGISVDQTYDGTSANAQSGVAIEGELTTNYQEKLVSGTNIKTINNTSLLGSGNISALENTATATSSITVDGVANTTDGYSINIGKYSEVANSSLGGDVVIGSGTSASLNAAATGGGCTAIGYRAKATGEYSIQLGWGTNSTNKTLAVGFQGTNFELLNGTTGFIPDARIDNNRFDGQWVHKYFEVATNTAANPYSHDLSSYLPSDNYSYEVFLRIGCYYKSSNASFTVGTVASPNTNKSTSGNYYVFQYVTSYSRGGYCNAIIPVGTSRTIYSQITAVLDNSTIELFGYRRIGTNS